MRKVLIIDTCLLCVWLKAPNMGICHGNDYKWDFKRVDDKIKAEIANSTTLVLPVATVVETGNHIAQANAKDKKFKIAEAFAHIMTDAADEKSPWAAFSEQIVLWEADALKDSANNFPTHATQATSMGDASIVILGKYYREEKGYHVEFVTADKGLKSQEPPPPPEIKRRSGRNKKQAVIKVVLHRNNH